MLNQINRVTLTADATPVSFNSHWNYSSGWGYASHWDYSSHWD